MSRKRNLLIYGALSAVLVASPISAMAQGHSATAGAAAPVGRDQCESFSIGESSLITHKDWVRSAQFSPGSKFVVTASDDGTAKIVKVSNGKERQVISHKHWVNSAQFSPNSKFVVTASNDGTAEIVEVGTDKWPLAISHYGPVRSAQFSPDSKFVVTASFDGTAKILEIL